MESKGMIAMTAGRTGKRRKWPWVVLAILIASPYVFMIFARGSSGIVHRFEPIRGRVVDAKTGAPLDGAVVVAEYEVVLESVGGYVRNSVDAAEAVTGPDGVFEIPSRVVFGTLFPLASFVDEGITFYTIRRGYGCLRKWSALSDLKRPDGTVEFRLRDDLTKEERKQKLDGPFSLSKKIPAVFQIIQSGERFFGLGTASGGLIMRLKSFVFRPAPGA
jgi:hypothetical protein